MSETIQRIKDVQRVTKLSRSTIYSKVKQGQFPPPIKLGERASGWLASEVSEWVQARIDESRRAGA